MLQFLLLQLQQQAPVGETSEQQLSTRTTSLGERNQVDEILLAAKSSRNPFSLLSYCTCMIQVCRLPVLFSFQKCSAFKIGMKKYLSPAKWGSRKVVAIKYRKLGIRS